jgi:exportin-2 (importin alpha re-exporter)
MLELHASSVPNEYRSILPFLLTPAAWQQKGSVPGLVKLLKAFLTRDSAQLVETRQYTAILAVVQQRLIPSKINDGWGFELLEAVVQNIPPCVGVLLPLLLTLHLNRIVDRTSASTSLRWSSVY